MSPSCVNSAAKTRIQFFEQAQSSRKLFVYRKSNLVNLILTSEPWPKRKFSNPLDELTDPIPHNPTPQIPTPSPIGSTPPPRPSPPATSSKPPPTNSPPANTAAKPSPSPRPSLTTSKRSPPREPALRPRHLPLAHRPRPRPLRPDGERPQIEIRQIRGEALRKHWTSE